MEDIKNLLKEIQEKNLKKSELEKELQELYSQKQEIINPFCNWIRNCSKVKHDIVKEADDYLLKLKEYESLSENDLQVQINEISTKITDANSEITNLVDKKHNIQNEITDLQKLGVDLCKNPNLDITGSLYNKELTLRILASNSKIETILNIVRELYKKVDMCDHNIQQHKVVIANLDSKKIKLLYKERGFVDYSLIREYISNILSKKNDLDKINLTSVSLTKNDKSDHILSQINILNDSGDTISKCRDYIIQQLKSIINEIETKANKEPINDIPYSSDITRLSENLKYTLENIVIVDVPYLTEEDEHKLKTTDESIKETVNAIKKLQNEIRDLFIDYGEKEINDFSSNTKKAINNRITWNIITIILIIITIAGILILPTFDKLQESLFSCCGDCSQTIICVFQIILVLILIISAFIPICKLCRIGELKLLKLRYDTEFKNIINGYTVNFTVIKDIVNDKYDEFIDGIRNSSRIFSNNKNN